MKSEKKKIFIKNMKKDAALHLMLLLPVIMLFIFHHIPLFGIVIAFQNYNPGKGILGSDFVGLLNFEKLLTTPGFFASIQNTVIISVGKIILGIVVPVTVALLLNEMKNIGVKRGIQTLIYLPHFVSWVLMSGIIIEILNPTNGLVNQVIEFFGGDPVFFLGSNTWFRPVVWITDVWKEFGYSTIIYMSALAGIDTTLYEAAALDGAGHFRKVLHVTLPGIMATVVLMTILKIGNLLNVGFDQIFNLYSPVTQQTGDIIDTLVYRLGLGGGQFSLAAAAGLFKSVISGTFLIIAYKVAYKLTGYHVF